MNMAKAMTIDRWITDAAQLHPEKSAIEFEGQSLSYREFADQIGDTADSLQNKGIGYGDRVAWYGLNHPDVFVLLFACARIGAILVPLNWRLSDLEILEIVQHCEPSVIIADKKFHAPAQALPRAKPGGRTDSVPSVTDPLLIVYTSGATGKPKGVVLAQQALVANAEMSVQAHGLTPNDLVLNVLPLFHVGGLNILPTPAFSIGASVVLHRTFDPNSMMGDLQRVQAAITVPTVLDTLLALEDWPNANFDNLRCLSIGSTDVPLSQIQAVHTRGVPLLQIYGATETSPFAIYQSWHDAFQTEGSIGRSGDCEIKLVNEHGAQTNVNQPGEIWVRGKNTLTEYWRDKAQTKLAVSDGWFKTGDVARKDENSLYYFVDRIKHIIISGGENIYPAEIERLLRDMPDIKEVAVVGMPDQKWGEVPVIVAVPTRPLDPYELLASLKGKIARYKQPKRAYFVDALPRNAMGKVVASKVREMIADL